MIPQVDILLSFKFNLIASSKNPDQKSWKKVNAEVIPVILVETVLKCILSYKCQLKKLMSHIKKHANILLLKFHHF